MKGKLIEIEGTDCSGKETQSKLLVKRLTDAGLKVYETSFPMYNTPTGKIVGGPYLGKQEIMDGWFKEGATNVDPKVASLYFAADRRYNISTINKMLDSGINVILDRYVYSNMAHQGGKILDTHERMNMYAWLDILEFKLLELPKPDICIFLHMPYEQAAELRKTRNTTPDEHEKSKDHLMHAENAYLELASNYGWKSIECSEDGKIKGIQVINDEIFNYVMQKL